MNSFGHLFRVTTFGESHGAGLGCIVDGCPPKIPLTQEEIQAELDRRRPGQSAVTTSRKEPDKVKILSGIFEGKTLGTPIAMIVENTNAQSGDYTHLKDLFRPGHADYTWQMKYGFRDYRGGGRSSGRETVARVMGGAVAKKFLAYSAQIEIFAFSQKIGPVEGEKIDLSFIEKNSVRAADPEKAAAMEECVLQAKEEGDSVGGVVQIIVHNVPVGLGEPVFDKLNADLAKALFSIPTVKGVEFGCGFSLTEKKGSQANDPFELKEGRLKPAKNDAGGISGGISTGEEIVIRVAVKPPSSIAKEQKTATPSEKEHKLSVGGRHDPCIIPRFIPVAESMVALTLADHLLRYRAIKE